MNYSRMLHAALNKSWKQHTTKQQLYGSQNHPSKTNNTCWIFWRSKDQLKSNIILWTPTHRRASVGLLTKFYIENLFVDTG